MLYIFAEHVANSTLYINGDNHAVVEILNKSTIRDQKIMSIVRDIVLLTLKYNVLIKTVHIPGKCNILADLVTFTEKLYHHE